MTLTPKNAGELKPFLHQVMLKGRRGWIVQRSVLNCNRIMCWNLLTEPPLHSIHALKVLENINGEVSGYYMWNAEEGVWVEKEPKYFDP